MALLLTSSARKLDSEFKNNKDESVLTLKLCNCAGYDVFLGLLVLEVSHNLGNHTLGKLNLLALFLLLLVADPAVENGLHL